MELLISIVVPVYNVEKYLSQCVESILNQTYKNLEIILVDDGSTDKSSIICDDFKLKDNRIKVIHKKNGGLSSARNMGIDVATGDYVMFIDSDDYYLSNYAISKIVENLCESNADILTFGLKKYFEDIDLLEDSKYIFDRNLINFNDKKQTFNYLVRNNLFIASACNKALKNQFIKDNDLRFKEGFLSEDIEWSARLIIYSNVIDVLNESFYIYRQRKSSISKSTKKNKIDFLIKNIELCLEYNKKYNSKLKESNIIDEYMSYIAYQYMTLLVCLNSTKENIKNEWNIAKSYVYLLKYDLNKRVKIFNRINTYLGFRGLNLFIKVYLKIKKG